MPDPRSGYLYMQLYGWLILQSFSEGLQKLKVIPILNATEFIITLRVGMEASYISRYFPESVRPTENNHWHTIRK